MRAIAPNSARRVKLPGKLSGKLSGKPVGAPT